MKEFFIGIALFIVAIIFIAILSFGGSALGLFNLKFWGVKYQDAKTDLYYQSQSYREGKVLEQRKIDREKNRALKEDLETLNNVQNYLKPIN